MARPKASFCKHLKDRRFRKNENLILDIFISKKGRDITSKKISRYAKLGRSTFYFHHCAVKEIIPDYEKYILASFSSAIKKKLLQKNTQLKTIYLDMLVFILQNKKIFKMFLKFDDRKIINQMVNKIGNKIRRFSRLSEKSTKIWKIYVGEITEVIFAWGHVGFPEEKLLEVLSDIMYLTETCADRLAPIDHHD